jgi:hypothetical protein
MLKWLIGRRIRSFGRRYDYDVSYMHELLAQNLGGFMRFAKVAELSAQPGKVPASAWFAAKLVATIAEDCGPCTQLITRMADEAGVPARVVRAIIEGDEAAMDEDARLGWRFARATLAHDMEADGWREEITNRWGASAVVSLALGIATTRMFPTIKYAMGHGHSCQRIRVDGMDLVPAARAAAQTVMA